MGDDHATKRSRRRGGRATGGRTDWTGGWRKNETHPALLPCGNKSGVFETTERGKAETRAEVREGGGGGKEGGRDGGTEEGT